MKKEQGFTLIEMFIVIAVIGILAGIVLRGTAGFQQSARDTRRIGDLKNVQTYLELYFNRCGHYPGDANCGNAIPTTWGDPANPSSTSLVGALSSVTSPSNISKDPVSSRNYFYGVESTDLLQYLLGAKLEKDNKVLRDDINTVPAGFTTTTGANCDNASPNFGYCIQS
ncbi:MAG: type II secretion system protein [Candidatus Colwellbacteria bacterium]|nr:type II secretion system protein [Candidatus Colwellbacteria bacterium]